MSLHQVSIVILILIHACSASLPAAEAPPTARSTLAADRSTLHTEVTEPVRPSLGTRPACRLMARDPYLSNRVRQMSADGNVHLIEYTLQFPDGSSDNITGT